MTKIAPETGALLDAMRGDKRGYFVKEAVGESVSLAHKAWVEAGCPDAPAGAWNDPDVTLLEVERPVRRDSELDPASAAYAALRSTRVLEDLYNRMAARVEALEKLYSRLNRT